MSEEGPGSHLANSLLLASTTLGMVVVVSSFPLNFERGREREGQGKGEEGKRGRVEVSLGAVQYNGENGPVDQ